MGLWKKLFGEKEAVFIEGNGEFDLEVVGESNYQKSLKKLSGGYTKVGCRKSVVVKLHHEDNNAFDNKAIRVDVLERTVGYLSRDDARLYRKKVKKAGNEGIVISCNAVIVGGKKTGLLSTTLFGVYIDLPLEEV